MTDSHNTITRLIFKNTFKILHLQTPDMSIINNPPYRSELSLRFEKYMYTSLP